jgi:hypothetical protein
MAPRTWLALAFAAAVLAPRPNGGMTNFIWDFGDGARASGPSFWTGHDACATAASAL